MRQRDFRHFIQDSRIRLANLRMETNKIFDAWSEWVDEYETSQLKRAKAKPINLLEDKQEESHVD